MDELKAQWQADRLFSPGMNPRERDILTGGWWRAVRTASAWAHDPENKN